MPALKRWEPWEDALLRQGERTTAADTALGRRLGRSPKAVRVRRSRIDPLGRPHERWTPAQDEAVTEHYRRFNEFAAASGALRTMSWSAARSSRGAGRRADGAGVDSE